jgi:hypothetical protein
MGVFRRAPLLTSQVRVPAGALLLSPAPSSTKDTAFTAAVSFATQVDKTFTAAASFAVLVDNAITASASFATLVDKTFTASSSFQKWEATWTAAVSFQGLSDTAFNASVSFSTPSPGLAAFSASVSFSQLALSASEVPIYFPYPESFEPHYEVRLATPDGIYTDIIDSYANLSYTLVTNDIGTCSIELPPTYPVAKLVKDARIEIWRGVGFGDMKLEGNTQFLIQTRERATDSNGNKTLRIGALSLNHILKRRVVAYRDDELTLVDIADSADDIMKLIVRTNFGSSATDTNRQISTDYLSIDSDTSQGQVVWKKFPHQNVLDTIKEIADASFQLGTPIFFDIIVDQSPKKLVFRTWAYTRGADRRFSQNKSTLLIGFKHGSIGSYTITDEWSNEIGYVYAAGPGEDDVRDIQVAQDSEIIGKSPYARSELWTDSQDSQTSDNLLNEAGSLLVAHRVRKLFVGKLLSIPQATYGIHWGWGDYVTADVEDEQFDCYVSGVSVQIASPDGKEDIDASLRND